MPIALGEHAQAHRQPAPASGHGAMPSPLSARSTASASSTMLTVMQPATSMSRLANWPPTKTSGCASNASSAAAATRSPHQRRANSHSATAPAQAPRIGAARKAASWCPNTDIDAAVIQ
ncbi:MAG: hypothetical protein U1F67_02685 [Rubrivivax sp.]